MVVITRVTSKLLKGAEYTGRKQIILCVCILCMSIHGTSVRDLLNIIWRKYVHMYVPIFVQKYGLVSYSQSLEIANLALTSPLVSPFTALSHIDQLNSVERMYDVTLY